MFVDEAVIEVIAGKGGDGITSFRHEKFVAKGGPDGGDGGKGGDVIARADTNVNTLAKYRHHKQIKAEAGERGKKRRAHGKNGKDIEIILPVGTVVYDGEAVVVDLTEPGQTAVLAQGGRGGFGNAHFTSSTRQAPQMAELGERGEERQLRLELKSVADIGLVGLPNAGKSTLLSVISNARPQVADYAFTTLVPNLGVAEIYDDSVVVADIPGLIEGASQGKGLGDEFLRHIERTKVLMHLVDAGSNDVVTDYRTIRKELESYSALLADKAEVVLLTKIDAVPDEIVAAHRDELTAASSSEVYLVSSVAHAGLTKALGAALKAVQTAREQEAARAGNEAEDAMPTLTVADDPALWQIEADGNTYVVIGEQIEGFMRRTDTANEEAMQRLRDILHKRGIARELQRHGIKPGDTVMIADKKFTW